MEPAYQHMMDMRRYQVSQHLRPDASLWQREEDGTYVALTINTNDWKLALPPKQRPAEEEE